MIRGNSCICILFYWIYAFQFLSYHDRCLGLSIFPFLTSGNNKRVPRRPTLLNIDQLSSKNLPLSPSLEDSSVSEWDVYVCMSKQSRALGAAATLAAFKGLAPLDKVSVYPVSTLEVFQSDNKSNKKGAQIGPFVRCIQRNADYAIDVHSCDSVGKVYRVLSLHMGLKKYIDSAACECLTWNYMGNSRLDKASNLSFNHAEKSTSSSQSDEVHTNINAAIYAYNKALATGYKPQEGVLLVMRSTAYLQRALEHRKKLKEVVSSLIKTIPDPVAIQTMYEVAYRFPWSASTIFDRMRDDTAAQDSIFRRLKFQHGLYEYALLHAAQDSLRATQILPNYAKTWLRAGDSLAELRKLRESTQYYEKALEIDPSLHDTLTPTIERLQKSQRFFDKARANGWSEDTLRVSLDVAG